MHGTRKLLLGLAAIAVTAAASVPAFAGAVKPVNSVVVPGKSISGIRLGETKKAVHDSKPLEMKKPTSSVRSPIPALGTTALSETYTTVSSVGRPTTLVVSYLLPNKNKKKHKKKKQPRVIFISTGQGFWSTFTPPITYDTASGEASNRNAVGEAFGCSFFKESNTGGRDYDVTESDAQQCELIFSQDTYMYFSFNNGYSAGPGGTNLPAFLAGFTLSRFQIP
jgi:hypothetical protein